MRRIRTVLALSAVLALVAVDGASAADITGTNGADTIIGTADNDSINGLKGNDRIDGLAGDDVLIGSYGHDTLIGGTGEDSLYGKAGSDTIYLDQETTSPGGEARKDHAFGGPNNDTIYAQDGVRDHIDCGGGTDTAFVDPVDLTSGCENEIFPTSPT